MTAKTRTVLRLSPYFHYILESLLRRTTASSKAEVARYAIDLYFSMWQHHLQGAIFDVRCKDGDLFSINLGPVVDDGFGSAITSETKLTMPFQIRLGLEHQGWLDSLVATGAAPTKSAVLRAAIDLYQMAVTECEQSHDICAVFKNGLAISVFIRGLVSGAHNCSSGSISREVSPRAVLPVLRGGETITLQQIKTLHESKSWGSVLVHLSTLRDNAEFFPIVQWHIDHGTTLFYVHYNPDVLLPLKERLRNIDPQRFEKSQDLLVFIPEEKERFHRTEEIVVFDFLQPKSSIGVTWDTNRANGTVATRDQLQTIERKYFQVCKQCVNSASEAVSRLSVETARAASLGASTKRRSS